MTSLQRTLFSWLAFVCATLPLATFATAAERGEKPRIFYYVFNSIPPTFGTPDEALSYVKARWGNDPRRTWTGIVPTGTTSINDKTNMYGEYTFNYNGSISKGGVLIEVNYECGLGTKPDLTGTVGSHLKVTCVPENPAPSPSGPSCGVGNPICPATGEKTQREIDYVGGGSNSLGFVRIYSSRLGGWSNNFNQAGIDFSAGGQASQSVENGCVMAVTAFYKVPHCFKYATLGSTNDFAVKRAGRPLLDFGTNSDFSPVRPDVNDRVVKVLDNQGQAIGWEVFNAENNAKEFYDLSGKLTSIRQRSGQTLTFAYSNELTPADVAPRAGLLVSVSDNFGYQIRFTYNADGRMSTMISPDGEVTTYQYDEATSILLAGKTKPGNLTSVIYPGGKKRIYWYNEQDKTDGTDLPMALTGITDENGARFATFRYDYRGRGISTEHAGGVEKYTIALGSSVSYVTDPLGQRNAVSLANVLGSVRITGWAQTAGAGSPAATVRTSYDAQGNVKTKTNANGIVTSYEYDLARNLEVSRVEAFGKPEARTTTTEWHPTLRIPFRVAEPKLRTTMTFDADGNVLTRTVQATTDNNGSQGFNATLTGKPRVWTYTYNAFGQVLTETAPRTDVVVKTIYTYDASGNLKTVTNPAGQVTTFNTYDANGRATMITAPSGAIHRMTYAPRGWLMSQSVESADGSAVQTTSYSYDDAGQPLSVTLPDQSIVYYTYDEAHRLKEVRDSIGNKITYTLDNMGNRIGEQVTDPAGTLSRQITRQYDAVNRLQAQTGGVQ